MGYPSLQEVINDYMTPLYLIGLFSFLISRVITITGTFEVFVNNHIVYKKRRMDTMESFDVRIDLLFLLRKLLLLLIII